jgi:hypothetical protein
MGPETLPAKVPAGVTGVFMTTHMKAAVIAWHTKLAIRGTAIQMADFRSINAE